MLESMAGWLTPTSLFLLLNIVIGTIWLTSLFGTNHKKHQSQNQSQSQNQNQNQNHQFQQSQEHQFQQSQHDHSPEGRYNFYQPSLIERVKSIGFGLNKYEHHRSDGDNHHHHDGESHAAAQSPPLSRAPSLFGRVKSVNFSDFQFSFFGSESQNAETVTDPNQNTNTNTNTNTNSNSIQSRDQDGPDLRSRLSARAPSLLQRVKSITFTDLHQISLFRSDPPLPEPKLLHAESDPAADLDQHLSMIKSEARKAKMKKSASEKMEIGKREVDDEVEETERRRPATTRVERTASIGGDVEVDSKADDFINKFKNQLKLQRLDSFVQYTDMITRGASR